MRKHHPYPLLDISLTSRYLWRVGGMYLENFERFCFCQNRYGRFWINFHEFEAKSISGNGWNAYSLDCMVIDLIESKEKVTVFLSVFYDWIRNTWHKHTHHYIQDIKSAWSLHEISSINFFKSSCPLKHTGWVVLITSCYHPPANVRAKPLCHSVTKLAFNTHQRSPVNLSENTQPFH